MVRPLVQQGLYPCSRKVQYFWQLVVVTMVGYAAQRTDAAVDVPSGAKTRSAAAVNLVGDYSAWDTAKITDILPSGLCFKFECVFGVLVVVPTVCKSCAGVAVRPPCQSTG